MAGDEIRDPDNPYGEESPFEKLELSRASRALQQARPWVLLLGVMTMLMAVLLALATVGLAVAAALDSGLRLPLPFWVILLFYLLGAVVYFLPSLLLLKFSRRIKEFSYKQTVRHLNAALATQKSFWKTIGICALVLMVVYLMMVLVVFFVGPSVN